MQDSPKAGRFKEEIKNMAHNTKKKVELVSTEELDPRSRYSPPSRAGSIEQQLDMIENGELRGDEILHSHGVKARTNPHPTLTEDQMQRNYRIDMSEEGREGDEESGDEHSSGFQGEDEGITFKGEQDTGLPGEMTEQAAKSDPSERGYKRRAS